jgi:lambda family phage tail tape measure protein
MANQRYVLEFSLEDVGSSLKGRKKDADAYRGSLDSIIKATDRINNSNKGGYKKAAMGNNEYDIARGSAGATGASGRDFANQARGLDGLVRLYATYAANLFAAGAAFRALSEAADTSNMIQGMNQLGSVSGLALGSIAKNLVAATDGAISMREAVEATTKGTAAGLSAKQMTQLGEVANKASKALGIGMPDAISRLTRGISKLEPELLDELGLFTKIGPATENYARSIGKTASQLTDFEKRQAFANAVLKEGTDKFNAIDIPANPYDKLLASLKNLSFAALELTNKVLVPLVSVLSQNPTALVAVLTAIGASIVKSAIPALGHYRENLKKTAEESRQAFNLMYKNQQDAFGNLASDQASMAERSFRKSKEVRDRIKDLSKEGSTFTKGTKVDYAALASKDPFALTANEIKSLEDRARRIAVNNAEEADRLRKHVAKLKAIRAESATIGDTAASKTIEGSEKWWSTAFANDRINKEKLQTLAAQTIRSNVAETQSLLGMRAAWSKLNQDVDAARKGYLDVQTSVDKFGNAQTTTAPKMGKLDAYIVKGTAGVGMLVQKLGTTVSAFGNIGAAIGAAIGAFGLLDSFVTNTTKETTAFNTAMDGTKEAVDSANRTLDYLRKQPGIATATIQGFLALSNASKTLTDSIDSQIQATKDLLKSISTSGWDQVTDGIAGIFNQDTASRSAKTLASSVQAQLRIFREAGIGDEASAAFKGAIGVESLDLETVAEKFKTSQSAQDNFAKSNKQLSNILGESSSRLQNFKTSAEAVTKAYEEFIQSTANNNPIFKVAIALEDLGISMSKITKGSLKEITAAFNNIVDNPGEVAQFGGAFIDQFVAIRQEFKTTLDQYESYGQGIRIVDDEIAKTKQALLDLNKKEKTDWIADPVGNALKRENLNQDLEQQQGSKDVIKNLQLGIDIEVFKQAQELFAKGVNYSFEKGAEYMKKALGDAAQKAALSVAQAGIGALSGELAARESAKLKQQEFKIQLDAIATTINLITSNTLLTATINESNALMAVAQAEKDKLPKEVKENAMNSLLAARIFKQGMKRVEEGTLQNSDLNSLFTGNEAIDTFLKALILPVQRKIAQQNASATETKGKAEGSSIESERAIRAGAVEDANKLKNLNNDINQQLSARLDILMGINTLNSAQLVKEKAILEDKILVNKHEQEIAAILVAMDNALAIKDKAAGDKQLKNLDGQLKLVKERQEKEKDNKGLSDRVKSQAEELANAIKFNALLEGITDQEINRKNTINNILGLTTEESAKQIASLETQKLINKFALELQPLQNDVNNAVKEYGDEQNVNVIKARMGLDLVKARQAAELDNKGLQDALKLLEVRFSYEQKLAGFRKTSADAQDQQAEDDLNYKKALGLLTDEQFAKEKAQLDRSRVYRETAQQMASLDQTKKLRDLAQSKIDQVDEAGGDVPLATDVADVYKMTTAIELEGKAIIDTENQKLNAINNTERLSDKMVGFSQVVQNSFAKMGDALVTFAITGKGSFKDLINSMLEDLIRFEMSNQMKALYSAFGGLSGMGSYVVSAFTGTPPVPSAKGSVYDTGLQTFAKGGMFTNSIVNQPTLFKFAQGTGLMGEAGPEAIMPLKRDSNGNLGVRSNQGKVDVIVNNYSNQQAKTKETMDSRGNRRIEVIVGDMVAGELNRVGSTTQQAMTASYGTSPLLARR